MNTVTDKQADFLRRLANDRVTVPGLSAEDTIARVDAIIASGELDRRRASAMIEAALAAPKRQAQDTPMARAVPGYYVTESGDFVVVIENRAKTGTYAKALLISEAADGSKRGRWAYTAGLASRVAHLRPMTLEEAKEFGHLHGFCFVCGRALTDPASVERGIGPVCATKFGREAA